MAARRYPSLGLCFRIQRLLTIPTYLALLLLSSQPTQARNTRLRMDNRPIFSLHTRRIIAHDATDNRAVELLARDDDTGDDDQTHRDVKVLENYYYAFVAIGVVLIIIALWLEHKRRRRRKQITQSRRQTALAQDANGWPNTRRWYFGNWRMEPTSTAGREEGLNERGEAPPPYRGHQSQRQSRDETAPRYDAATVDLTEPSRAVTRARSFYKPPDYEETIRSVTVTSDGSDAGASFHRHDSTTVLSLDSGQRRDGHARPLT